MSVNDGVVLENMRIIADVERINTEFFRAEYQVQPPQNPFAFLTFGKPRMTAIDWCSSYTKDGIHEKQHYLNNGPWHYTELERIRWSVIHNNIIALARVINSGNTAASMAEAQESLNKTKQKLDALWSEVDVTQVCIRIRIIYVDY